MRKREKLSEPQRTKVNTARAAVAATAAVMMVTASFVRDAAGGAGRPHEDDEVSVQWIEACTLQAVVPVLGRGRLAAPLLHALAQAASALVHRRAWEHALLGTVEVAHLQQEGVEVLNDLLEHDGGAGAVARQRISCRRQHVADEAWMGQAGNAVLFVGEDLPHDEAGRECLLAGQRVERIAQGDRQGGNYRSDNCWAAVVGAI